MIAIYARETGHGMALPDDPQGTLPADEADAPTASASRAADEGPGDDTPEPPKRGGHLRIVK